jgi:hypothetical protein
MLSYLDCGSLDAVYMLCSLANCAHDVSVWCFLCMLLGVCVVVPRSVIKGRYVLTDAGQMLFGYGAE